MNHIFLYGPPGSGKSTVGRLLATKLEMPFVDLDDELESLVALPIPQIMEERGEAGFRKAEFAALKHVIEGQSKLIALGGGALLLSEARERVEAAGAVVLLEAGLDTLIARLEASDKPRPLLACDLRAQLSALLSGREEHYNSFVLRVATNTIAPDFVTREIQVILGRFRLRGMGRDYDVVVEVGASKGLGEELLARDLAGPVAIVSDENIAPLYADCIQSCLREAGLGTHLVTFPAGELHKSLRTVQGLWESFVELGLDRQSMILALGGGVVGDLAGFVAATYMRGVAWVVVPTSLVAMLDAAIGGKTAFDLPQGKNLIGAFHAPRLVLADPSLLSTLPVPELRSGLAEAVKCGVIADAVLFELLGVGFDKVRHNLPQVIRRAIAVKAHVVETDPYEENMRSVLNFGHTVGHALEAVSGYTIRHGEAVSSGMVAEARLAEHLGIARPGLSDRISEVLTGLELPVELPAGLSPEQVLRAMRMDKKSASATVRFALPSEIGRMELGVATRDLSALFPASDRHRSATRAGAVAEDQ